jgi:hypothetical protein
MAIGNIYQRFLPGMSNIPGGPQLPAAPQSHYYQQPNMGMSATTSGGNMNNNQTSPFMGGFTSPSNLISLAKASKAVGGNIGGYGEVAKAYGYSPTAGNWLGAGTGLNGGAAGLQNQLAMQHAIAGGNPALANSVFGQGLAGDEFGAFSVSPYAHALPGLAPQVAGSGATMPTPMLNGLGIHVAGSGGAGAAGLGIDGSGMSAAQIMDSGAMAGVQAPMTVELGATAATAAPAAAAEGGALAADGAATTTAAANEWNPYGWGLTAGIVGDRLTGGASTVAGENALGLGQTAGGGLFDSIFRNGGLDEIGMNWANPQNWFGGLF